MLVLRALGLGDALTGIPALRGIRRAWPDRRLILATSAALGQWLQGLGVIDDVLPTDGLAPLRLPPDDRARGGGHIAVNLHGSGPQSHRLLQQTGPAELVAFRCAPADHVDGPQWRHDEHEVDRWCRLMMAWGGRCDATDLLLRHRGQQDRGQTVLLHPGAASESRRWPADRWSWLAAELAAQGFPVFITGGPSEIALCHGIAARALDRLHLAGGQSPQITVAAGTLGLSGLTDVVAAAQLLICGDTGVGHLATALGTPSVLLFGPTPVRWWGPRIDLAKHRVLWHGDRNYLGDAHADTIDPALEAISQEEVLEAAEEQIRRAGHRGFDAVTPGQPAHPVLKAG